MGMRKLLLCILFTPAVSAELVNEMLFCNANIYQIRCTFENKESEICEAGTCTEEGSRPCVEDSTDCKCRPTKRPGILDMGYEGIWDMINVYFELGVAAFRIAEHGMGMWQDIQSPCDSSDDGLGESLLDLADLYDNPKDFDIKCAVLAISHESSQYEGGHSGQMTRAVFQAALAAQKIWTGDTCDLKAMAAMDQFAMSMEVSTLWNCIITGKKGFLHRIKEIWYMGWANGSIELFSAFLRQSIFGVFALYNDLSASSSSTALERGLPGAASAAKTHNWHLFSFNIAIMLLNFLRRLMGNFCYSLDHKNEIKNLDHFYAN